jgi:hypothetical protein
MREDHPPAPPDITVHAILVAKLEELKWWIARANDAAKVCGGKKKPLTKTGNSNELRRKLADYYGLNLDVPVVAKTTGVKDHSLDGAIRKRQWAHLRALGGEWKGCAERRQPFVLCPSTSSLFYCLLLY